MSTFVLELETLPRAAGYKYALLSVIFSQIAPILLVDIYSAVSAQRAIDTLSVPPISMCDSYVTLCGKLLDHFSCPTNQRIIRACDASNSLVTFSDACSCGTFNGSKHMAELLIDSQCINNISSSLVPVWPTYLTDAASDPTSVIDPCITFDNLCDHFLNRINCPRNIRSLNSCYRSGLTRYTGTCNCGSLTYASKRLGELIVDYTTGRRDDLLPYILFPTSSTVNFCTAYNDVCSRMLDHVQCPLNSRVISGCTNSSDYSTWVGTCTCYGAYDVASSRIAESLFNSLLKPHLFDLVYRPSNTTGSPSSLITGELVDSCATYEAVCKFFLDAIGCPANLRTGNAGCSYPDGSIPYGGLGCLGGNCSAANWVGICQCGPINFMSEIVLELTMDTAMQSDMVPFQFYPPSQAAFSLVTASNPFRPLLALKYPLPTQ
jgi:hypothetical protein